MNRKIVQSSDGTPTIYVEKLDQHYHSIFGARTESEHIYIRAGLEAMGKKEIHLLEIGFGTGLNACLSLIHKKPDATIYYLGIEKYPLKRYEWEMLHYFHPDEFHPAIWNKIHSCPWETWNHISQRFHLFKKQCDFNEFSPPKGLDLIYFDAFSPDAQPELWSPENFKKIYLCLNPGGILVTYSVKGKVRKTLADAGFRIEKLPGPPGKRQILRAFN